MLFKALARPLVNTITKVPSRSTSAIVGRRTNNVSVAVSSREKIDSTFFRWLFGWKSTTLSPIPNDSISSYFTRRLI